MKILASFAVLVAALLASSQSANAQHTSGAFATHGRTVARASNTPSFSRPPGMARAAQPVPRTPAGARGNPPMISAGGSVAGREVGNPMAAQQAIRFSHFVPVAGPVPPSQAGLPKRPAGNHYYIAGVNAQGQATAD